MNMDVTINGEIQRRAAEKHIKILIIDEHRAICEIIRRMLEEEGMQVVGVCSSADEAFPEIARLRPGIVLMGARLSGMNSIEATRSFKRNGLNYEGDVIVLAESVNYGVEAIKAGAAAYLLTNMTRLELTQTIRQVYQSRHPLEDSLDSVEDTVELIIPPSTDASRLSQLLYQAQKILKDNRNNTIQVVGSWNRDTVIKLKLGTTMLNNLLDKLASMPDVEELRDEPQVKVVFPKLTRKFGVQRRSSTNHNRRIRIILKKPGTAYQTPAIGLNKQRRSTSSGEYSWN